MGEKFSQTNYDSLIRDLELLQKLNQAELINSCAWYYNEGDDNYYETSCNNAFQFAYGRKELNFKYCPYCGKKINEKINKT